MRVTQHTIATSSLANLQANLGRLSSLQEQMTSGKVINKPSDSPTGTISALELRGQVRAGEQHSRNADDGVSWLTTQDTALQSVNDVVQRARVLLLQGASTGNSDPEARAALAAEVSTLRDSAISLANTTYLGRPVFGGTTDGSQAFDSAGAYVGDSGQVMRRIGTNSTVRVDTDGQAAFGTGAGSVFAVLDKIAGDLTASPADLHTDLGSLDAATEKIKSALTDVGARYNRADAGRTAADDRVLTLRATLSGVEDIDLPHTILDMQMQQMAYQTALGATAKALQPSLMDFLR